MVISIIRWVCHDLLLLGSLVSCDESSASLFVAPNYWDGPGDRRRTGGLGEVGCMQVRREEKEEGTRPSSLDLGARIPTYEQQISIGIPFIIHHTQADSEGLRQVGCVASAS